MPTIHELRNQFRRTAGLNFFRATLGDENGVIDEPGRPGYVRIRYTQASGLGKATTVRFRAVMQKVVGMPVEVGYDTDGEMAVLRADFAAQLATGINPLGNNPSDNNVGYFINQSQITTLLSHPVSSASDSMLVTVEPFLYLFDGTLHYFLGGDGDGATPIDLTASIPGSASQQCAACLFLKTTDDLIEIQASTPIDIGDDLGIADVQECITASTYRSIMIHAWRLYYGQTGINPADLTAGGDNFLDLRQLINTGSVELPGFGAGVIITLASDVAAVGTYRHVILAAETGTADNCIEITGLNVGDEIIVRPDAGDTITLKNNDAGATDKIYLAGGADLALSNNMTVKLCKVASGVVVQYQ